jgi:hypothetical protein
MCSPVPKRKATLNLEYLDCRQLSRVIKFRRSPGLGTPPPSRLKVATSANIKKEFRKDRQLAYPSLCFQFPVEALSYNQIQRLT